MAIKVLLDTDPGIDDSIAIMLALKSPEMKLVGITTVSGNVPADLGAENARRVVELCGRPEVPVFVGEHKPLEVPLVTAQDTHGSDGLGESNLPAPWGKYLEGGVDFILTALAETPGLTIVALGPLTNIARAHGKNPGVFGNLSRLIVMGGSIHSPGNMTPGAEFNFWCDPHGAAYVFEHLENITMVGLDVTRKLVLSPDQRELLRQFDTYLSRFIHSITRYYLDYHWLHERTLGCVLNDPLALALHIWPHLVSAQPARVSILTEGEERGSSLADFNSPLPNAQVCLEVEAEKVMELLLSRICPEHTRDLSMYFSGASGWIHPASSTL